MLVEKRNPNELNDFADEFWGQQVSRLKDSIVIQTYLPYIWYKEEMYVFCRCFFSAVLWLVLLKIKNQGGVDVKILQDGWQLFF